MRITAVVLNWNGEKYITDCLQSLKLVRHPGVDFKIVVVDNDSQDGSADIISKKFPEVTLVRNDHNAGFAEGHNSGIKKALEDGSEYVWILNPDTVVDEGALVALMDAASEYKLAGVFGSKIYYAPGTEFHKTTLAPADSGHVLWYAGGVVDWTNLITSSRGKDEVDHTQYDHDIETDFISSVSMFVRRRVLESAGLFDWRYFLYFEENDFCERVKKAGWRLMYVCQSRVWHAAPSETAGGASGIQDYYRTRNRLLFGLRHAPIRTKVALVRESLRIYLSGRPWQRRGVLDYFTGTLGPGSFES